MNPFDICQDFWRRHPGAVICVLTALALLAVIVSQLNQTGSVVVYKNF